MNTTGWKADWEKDGSLVSSRIALSGTGNAAELSWSVTEAAGLGSPWHSEGRERKGIL